MKISLLEIDFFEVYIFAFFPLRESLSKLVKIEAALYRTQFFPGWGNTFQQRQSRIMAPDWLRKGFQLM